MTWTQNNSGILQNSFKQNVTVLTSGSLLFTGRL